MSKPTSHESTDTDQESCSALAQSVKDNLHEYFNQLGDEKPSDLYSMVMREVEGPMLSVVMKHVSDNQSQAADMLGINRGTLRKKLKEYHLL